MEELNENSDIIKKALDSLHDSVNVAPIPDNEKVALKALIEKLRTYYNNKLDIMTKKGIDVNSNDERVMVLKCFISDIIVEINNVLTGESDVYYFIGVITNRLHSKEIEKTIKWKRK